MKMSNKVEPVITTRGQYKNLDLRATFKNDGDFIEIEKTNYAEGYKNTKQAPDGTSYDFYNCKVIVNGTPVSFIVYEADNERFSAVDAGAKCTMTLHKEMYVDKKGIDRVKKYYTFKAIE